MTSAMDGQWCTRKEGHNSTLKVAWVWWQWYGGGGQNFQKCCGRHMWKMNMLSPWFGCHDATWGGISGFTCVQETAEKLRPRLTVSSLSLSLSRLRLNSSSAKTTWFRGCNGKEIAPNYGIQDYGCGGYQCQSVPQGLPLERMITS